MSAPVEKPSTCGECRQYHEPRPYNERGDTDTCSPRGTRWHLTRKATAKACGSVHALKPAVKGPDQGSLL